MQYLFLLGISFTQFKQYDTLLLVRSDSLVVLLNDAAHELEQKSFLLLLNGILLPQNLQYFGFFKYESLETLVLKWSTGISCKLINSFNYFLL